MITIIADGLEELNEEVVYVGGVVAELYADEVVLDEIRPTGDVDVIVQVLSRTQLPLIEEKLRQKGFQNDTSSGAPICRWIYKSILLDLMPDNEKILGFSNRWCQLPLD